MLPSVKSIHEWILNHDDSWIFIGSYITLAVVLSIWISLFWLVVVVAVHGLFEWICQQKVDTRIPGIVARVLWELKLDIGLIVFALALGVYMEMILGIAGLGAASRAGIQGGARVAGWQNALRGVLLSVDDAAQVARMGLAKTAKNGSEDDSSSPNNEASIEQEEPSLWGGWTEKWSKGDTFALGFGVFWTLAIVVAPYFTDHTWLTLLDVFAEELHPWP